MADDPYARIGQLEAELRRLCELHAAETIGLHDELARTYAERDEAVEHQAATAGILRVIAAPSAALREVIQALAEEAVRVCGAQRIAVYQLEGDMMRLADS